MPRSVASESAAINSAKRSRSMPSAAFTVPFACAVNQPASVRLAAPGGTSA
jgi:hypothetical protein